MASMEPDSAAVEELYYHNIKETRAKKPSAHPKREEKDMHAAKLNGKDKKTGPGILLKVMTGDKVSMSVESWWQKQKESKQPESKMPLMELAKAIASSIPIAAKNELLFSQAQENMLPALTEMLSKQETLDRNNKPKAYLNWILLDEDLKPYKDDTTIINRTEYSGYIQVGEENELKKHGKKDWKIRKPAMSGYLQTIQQKIQRYILMHSW
jgi:hypothetical protein